MLVLGAAEPCLYTIIPYNIIMIISADKFTFRTFFLIPHWESVYSYFTKRKLLLNRPLQLVRFVAPFQTT